MEIQNAAATPRHLWIVGILSLLWNAFGAYDFLMTNVRDAAYLEQMGVGAEMMQYIDAFPYWVMTAWAIGVWGGVAGSLLLLLRSKYAAYLFSFSLLGLAGSTFYQVGIGSPEEATEPGMIAMTLAIWAVAALLVFYSVRMRSQGTLR
ncbi:MAG: hypothetical protein P8J20_09645 [Novosphingobium sp.]|nr:hypothetical protein [Novosphingobium sp.]